MANGKFMYCGKLDDNSSGYIGKPNVLGRAMTDDIPGMPMLFAEQGKFAEDSTKCRGDGLATLVGYR